MTKDDSTEDEPVEYLPTMASRVNPTLWLLSFKRKFSRVMQY
ncbi:hypothetical protein LEP1GSC133_2575 [Leptospira borgpetersenii serovar Pomona str. 200901868]|uniref:Uncharacterized protein n=1 Tax=Leptospira borgpetersenii serovar Pomona str. 200901868 TaxID=1192866 RepID=M6VW51_LEPBO|nr:hypothetical protein LEP1GSC133_2575 [Leptospira borgpetersenii serovar Pomona str. 200901868]